MAKNGGFNNINRDRIRALAEELYMQRAPNRTSHASLRSSRWIRARSYWIGLIALVLFGCGRDDATGPSYDHLPERYRALAKTFDAQQERWRDSKLQSYQYTYQRTCFCEPDWIRPVVIDVVNNRIERIVYADDGAPVDSTYWASYHTVDGLFALIDSALARDAAQITVQFDEALGYPTQLYIDEDLGIADEELRIAASNMHPLP